jgi:hypothetical protein
MNEKDQQLVNFQMELIQLVNALRTLQNNNSSSNKNYGNDSIMNDKEGVRRENLYRDYR